VRVLGDYVVGKKKGKRDGTLPSGPGLSAMGRGKGGVRGLAGCQLGRERWAEGGGEVGLRARNKGGEGSSYSFCFFSFLFISKPFQTVLKSVSKIFLALLKTTH